MRKIYIENIKNISIHNEVLNIIKYTDSKMKEISEKAWSLLYDILLNEYDIKLDKGKIVYNEYQKPYFQDKKIYFNISHSDDLIAIIVDDKECGIDIEKIDKTKSIKNIVKKTMSKREQLMYILSINKYKYFYKKWTIKEAYYKHLGIGIKYNQLKNNIVKKHIKSFIYKDKETKQKYYISYTK